MGKKEILKGKKKALYLLVQPSRHFTFTHDVRLPNPFKFMLPNPLLRRSFCIEKCHTLLHGWI